MGALISERKAKGILKVQGSAGTFGLAALAIGLYLRLKLEFNPSGFAFVTPIISEMTDGYYGVMSGSLVCLLGIFGSAIIWSRKVYLVALYFFLLLACNVLCLLDLLMVEPHVELYGELSWKLQCQIFTGKLYEGCEKLKRTATLLICITTAISLAFLLTLINTFNTGFVLCQVKSEQDVGGQERPVQLAPYPTQHQPVQQAQGQGYVNTQFAVYQEGQHY